MSMRKAIVACLTAGSTVVIGGSLGPVSPAGADNVVGDAWVAGNFVGDARDEIFDYVGGAELDLLITMGRVGPPGGDLDVQNHPFNVGGNYLPVAGDFDGDNKDEIFWYGPGTTADSMWHFQSTSSAASVPYSVSGSYQPIVGDFTGDGVDDIFWYAPGAAGDPLWDFNQGGTYTSVSKNVGGTYTPVSVSIGKDNTDDIFWYGPGTAPDSLWDFTRGTTNYTTRSMPVNGVYRPVAVDMLGEGWRGDDIYFHSTSGGASPVWDFWMGQNFPFSETDSPGAGTFDGLVGDFFADTQEDIFWSSVDTLRLWDHNGLTRYDYLFASPAAGADARTGSGSGISASDLPGTEATATPLQER